MPECEDKSSDLVHLQEWLRQEPHLPDTWDEKWIETCFRWSKQSRERSKKKIDSYFTLKNALPEYFADRDLEKSKYLTKFLTMAPLPKLIMPEKHRVVILRTVTDNFDTFDPIACYKLFFMITEARMLTGDMDSEGDVYILDFNMPYYVHFLKTLSFADMKKSFVCIQEAFPARIKGMHFVNQSPVLTKVMSIVKPLYKEKIRNRIHMHSDLESLHKLVSKDILPEEYGGTCGSCKDLEDQTWKLLEDHQEWFAKTNDVKANESKRIGTPKNIESLFGMEGSFKKLSLD